MNKLLVPETQRLIITEQLFGDRFPMQLEPTIYTMADHLAESYRGGYWDFYVIGDDGFYMAPRTDERFKVSCENGYEGELSADALGITACLYAYSLLSFRDTSYAEHYHRLREFMFEHDEAAAILRAID